MKQARRLLVMAGGTGGHVIPALTIAKYCRAELDCDCYWLGTQQGIEARLVPAADIDIHYINIRGIRGKRMLSYLFAPFRIIHAIYQAYRIIKKIQPDAVLGMGGFASGPGAVAAWLAKIPLTIHEQNAVLGTTNRLSAYFAKHVLEGFPNTFPARYHPIYTGNPVRAMIAKLKTMPYEQADFTQRKMRVLVLGGSLGALIFNQIFPGIQAQCHAHIELWHQTGERTHDIARQAYQKKIVQPYRLDVFIEEMTEAYAWADLVVCRAGALTIAELAAAGLCSILIPYPYAIDDHQTANAQFLVQAGAAKLLPQDKCTLETMVDLLMDLVNNPEKLYHMRQSARALHVSNATKLVAEQCLERNRYRETEQNAR